MRKVFLFFATAMLLASLVLTGCSNSLPNSKQEGKNDFNYSLLLQMPKEYVGEADNVEYASLEQFKNHVFSKELVSGAIATIECVDTVFYITVRHDGEDIMISGNTVSKCKIVTIGESFNSHSTRNNAIVEVVQDYYVIPTNEKDTMDMFESFGANFIKDSTGEIIGMEIEDGNYALQLKNGVDYTLKICNDVLPMEPGIKYTGAIISYESVNTVQYLSPVENTQRYEDFQMSESVMNIATEIKQNFEN